MSEGTGDRLESIVVRPIHMGWNDHRDINVMPIPWWLGRADTDFAMRRELLLPIPINFIYSIAIGLYVMVRMGWMSRKAELAAYETGIKEGQEIGERIGQDKGREETVHTLMQLARQQAEVTVAGPDQETRDA